MSDWTAVDGLIRELGAVRVAANKAGNTRLSDAAVKARVDLVIQQAADAVDRTIDSPTDDEIIVRAWEKILIARRLVRSLQETVDRSRELAFDSVDLRRQAAALMVQSLAVRKSGKV